VNTVLGSRASTSALADGLALKQDLLGSSLTLGSLAISGDSLAGVLAHSAGVALTAGGATMAVFEPAGTTVRKLTVQEDLTTTGRLDVNSTTSVVCELGNYGSYLRCVNGHHFDTYTRSHGGGRHMNLQYYSGSYVRIGNTGGALGVNCNPGSGFQLDVVGSGRFSGDVHALSFPTSSDARLKAEVLPASLDECVRLVQAVRPQIYRRTDLDLNRRVGYIANSWDSELKDGMRNIMGPLTGEESLLSLDYSRIVPVLHGALLSALARISALESRLP
jgi:hypothetical protein